MMAPEDLRETIRGGLLSFPVTPFDATDTFDPKAYTAHLEWLSPNPIAGLFVAGGTGELFSLTPGEVVGEMSLFTGERRSATVTAAGRVAAIEITKDALKPILAGAPALVDRFAALVEQRHAELVSHNHEARRAISVGMGRTEIAARMSAFYSG